MILVNFKTYPAASGEAAVALALKCENFSKLSGVACIVCPQTVDLRAVVAKTGLPVWAQHVDSVERGRATGWFPMEVAKEAGAKGVLLNHSEHKVAMKDVEDAVRKSRELGMQSLVFVASVEEAIFVARFRPTYVGYEPPELVASKETSAARSKPDIIEKVVKAVGEVTLLVGAGVKDMRDVKVSLALGARGIAVSSGIVLAADQEAALTELGSGFLTK